MSGAEEMLSRRILVALAHPDDETFICGGTLAKYAARGAEVTLLCATRGEMGRRLGFPPTATRESLPVLREQELREACRALGVADLRLMGLRDKTLDYYRPEDLAARIGRVMDEVKPDVVITFHDVLGGHPDHCAIGRAARLAHQSKERDAGRGVRLYALLWSDDEERLKAIGATRQQVVRVDLDREAARRKMAAYRAHRTQSQRTAWLWESDEGALRRLERPEFFLRWGG